MKVKKLISILKEIEKENKNADIKIACDEEWNTIFNNIEIQRNGNYGAFVIFGLSGSEEESWEDVANNKFDRKID